MRTRALIVISFVLVLLAPISSFGFELERTPLVYLKHGEIDVLRDATKKQTFEEVRELYQAGGFTPIKALESPKKDTNRSSINTSWLVRRVISRAWDLGYL